MRFIIPKGKKLTDALENLSEFLEKNYSDYPYASGNVNIYLNVTGKDRLPESESSREFVMGEDGNFVDSDNLLIEEGFRDTFWRIDSFIKQYSSRVSFLQNSLMMKEKCRAEDLARFPDDEKKIKAWEEQIELTKQEIREAFFLEKLAVQLKSMRNENLYTRYSRVITYPGKGMSKDRQFKDVITVVEFNNLEGLRFRSCYFMNGKNQFVSGRFEEGRGKNRRF